MYMYHEGDPLLLCGDFNGRIGHKTDHNITIDPIQIPMRNVVDAETNKYGEYLVEFLTDSMCGVINGRCDIKDDNFTYVSTRGRSVVDYMITPYDQLCNISPLWTNVLIRTMLMFTADVSNQIIHFWVVLLTYLSTKFPDTMTELTIIIFLDSGIWTSGNRYKDPTVSTAATGLMWCQTGYLRVNAVVAVSTASLRT